MDKLILAALFGIVIFHKIVLVHWFVSAIIIGVLTFIFVGQRIELSLAATILSAVVLLIFSPSDSDRNDWGQQIQEQRQEQERQERRERERQERERQERERQEAQRQNKEMEARQERERQERLEREEQERLERQERQERERQEQAAVNVYNKIFTDYYGAISDHRFSDAYSLLSEKEKQHQGSLENFAEGRQNVADIEILNFTVTDERDTTVNADYRIKTKDKDGNGFLVRTFSGNVTFIKSAGTWKIDSLSSKKTDEHRE